MTEYVKKFGVKVPVLMRQEVYDLIIESNLVDLVVDNKEEHVNQVRQVQADDRKSMASEVKFKLLCTREDNQKVREYKLLSFVEEVYEGQTVMIIGFP